MDSNIVAMEVVTGVDDNISNEKITIFPNPTEGNFSIRFHGISTGTIEIALVNQLGEMILNKTLNTNNLNNSIINFNELNNTLSKGIYLLKITDTQDVFLTKKLIVQ